MSFEIRHKSGNNSNKKPGMYMAGKQDHLLVDLKARYGSDFVEIAESNSEFSKKGKILGLIRSIYNNRFNFEEFGYYLLYPQIFNRLIELASTSYFEATVHVAAGQALFGNEAHMNQLISGYGIPIAEITAIATHDLDVQRLWAIIYEGVYSIPMTNTLNGMLMSVNNMRNQYCSDGRTFLSRLI